LQYEEIEEEEDENLDDTGTDRSEAGQYDKKWTGGSNVDEKLRNVKDTMSASAKAPQSPVPPSISSIVKKQDEETLALEQTPYKAEQFVDQFNGCPVLKFQVVNEVGGHVIISIMSI
jgi:hypothetical protein